MSDTIKILAFAGGSRKESFNKKLVKASIPILENLGAEVTFLDLKDYPLPIFDEDYEAENNHPDNVRFLKKLFQDHDGFFISSPEYNGFFSGLFKNVIDWLSRPVEGTPPLECFQGKTAVLTAASPGGLGGIRTLTNVRLLLSNLKVHVIPDQFALSAAYKAFTDDGSFVDAKNHETIESLCQKFVSITKAIK